MLSGLSLLVVREFVVFFLWRLLFCAFSRGQNMTLRAPGTQGEIALSRLQSRDSQGSIEIDSALGRVFIPGLILCGLEQSHLPTCYVLVLFCICSPRDKEGDSQRKEEYSSPSSVCLCTFSPSNSLFLHYSSRWLRRPSVLILYLSLNEAFPWCLSLY